MSNSSITWHRLTSEEREEDKYKNIIYVGRNLDLSDLGIDTSWDAEFRVGYDIEDDIKGSRLELSYHDFQRLGKHTREVVKVHGGEITFMEKAGRGIKIYSGNCFSKKYYKEPPEGSVCEYPSLGLMRKIMKVTKKTLPLIIETFPEEEARGLFENLQRELVGQ